jgi:hypothetical protein
MDPLAAAALVIALIVPFHLLVRAQLRKVGIQERWRAESVVILEESALQSHSGPIGRYMGRDIWGSVTFEGVVYRYDRVQRPMQVANLQAGELYLEPGLVYKAS